jgi:hypothetical protein
MKKWAFLACGFLLLSALLITLPYLIERRTLQDQVLGYMDQSLQVKASGEAVGWRWFPLPAITITRLKAESESLTLVAARADLVVNPVFFLSGKWSLLRAKLIDPDLAIKETGQTLPTLPVGHLSIVNGTLRLPARELGQNLTLAPITLTGIKGAVSSSAHALKFKVSTATDFAKALTINATLNPDDGSYRADCRGDGVDSSRLISQPIHEGSLLPVIRGSSLIFHLHGLGPGRFQLQGESKGSSFTMQFKDQILKATGLDGFTLNRDHGDFSIDTNNLSLSEPRLRLNGRVARRMVPQKGESTPEWSIDLRGTDLDLGAIRTSVLNLFGQNPVAQEVCAIVRGGSATTARYTFSGALADFHHLKSMKIWAEAKDVPVTIPGLGLDLDRASGPIAIINDQLAGKGLSATIDKSHGKNGSLLLDLGKDDHAFNLDLDLDADLINLQDVLSEIIPSSKFQDELSRFVTIRGRAQGHLRLGDDLRHLETRVDVQAMQANGTYDRLPWPFTIKAGSLHIAPQQLEWDGVQGTLGDQRITNAQGGVTWKNAIQVVIKALNADLDLQPLFEAGTLQTNSGAIAIRDLIHGRFESVSGHAKLSDTVFSGPILNPQQWCYQTTVHCRDLRVGGTWLPELRSNNAEAKISQQQADFTGIFDLLDQQLFLSGRYRHTFFDKWHGDLEINGDIGQRLGEWFRNKNLVPAATLPKLPFRLEKLIVTNPEPGFDSLIAHGTIISQQDSDTTLQVNISRQADHAINTLTFLNKATTGTLSYERWPKQENRTLLTWQGELDAETLDALFPQHLVQSGQIVGTFSRLSDQAATVYSGSLEANGVQFNPESLLPDLSINTLRLQGNNNVITVSQADLALAGTPTTVSGHITETAGLHALDLRLTAPKLSWESIRKAVDEFTHKTAPAEREQSTLNSLRGTVAFDIGSFDYIRHPQNQEAIEGQESDHTFTASPLMGTVDFSPPGIGIVIDKSSVCGIGVQGIWHLNDESRDDQVLFTSGKTPLSFDKALPCLGVKQSLIIGPFSVEGRFSGRPKHWRQGTIVLTSPEGLIKRMNLLSTIFTTVNVTDYFTWKDLPNMEQEGLYYNDLALNAHIDDNHLVLDRTIVKGKGVNLSGKGTINLTDLNSDLTFFIAPFKSLDSVVTSIPLVGKSLGGSKESILTFPVTVTGNLKKPEVTALAPLAVGSAALEWFKDAFTLPVRIFQPDEGGAEQGK